jgi:hypothetical protein
MPLLRTLLLNAMLGLAGYVSARHGLRMPAGLPRGLAAFVLAWAWATLGLEVLGPSGYLSFGPLLAWTAAGLALAYLLRMRDGRGGAAEAAAGDRSEPHRWEGSAIVALGLVIWVALVHALNSLLGPLKVVSDGPIYHLYFAARWWKAGRLFLVATPFGETAAPYFPAVGDLWFTWLLVGWDGDRLARIGQVPFLVVAAMAAFANARRLGAGASSAVIASAWFASLVPLLLFTLEPNVDTIFVAGYLLAAYFYLGYALGDGGTERLALGALATGGVLGTKPTGIVFGGILLGAAALAVAYRRASMRPILRDLVVLGVLPLVMAGYWYGQNLILGGNPLYPLHAQAFGRVWLSGWYGSDAMRMSQYYLAIDDWRALGDIMVAVLDPRLAPIWVVALAGGWALGRPRNAFLDRWVWAFSALAVANLAAYWVLIPYRTQQRFMLQAFGLGVVPLARLFDRGRWIRVLAAGLLAVHFLSSQGWPFAAADQPSPWDLSEKIPNMIPPLLTFPSIEQQKRGVTPGFDDVHATLAVFAIGAGSITVAWFWSRPGRPSKVRAILASLSLASLALLLTYPYKTDPRALFFPGFREYYRGWLELDARSGPSGTRVAYAGTNLPYYLMGAGLRNEVRYVNIDARRGWLLHDYHRLARTEGAPTWPNPWPTWDRAHPDYDAWLANLREEGIQILVVASMGRPPGSLPDADSERFPIERRWAETHPEAFAPLYGVAERDPNIRIYRVRPARH